MCERFFSRHQWGSHRSVVWAKSTVFPRIHLPSGVHGHPGGRYEWWPVTWTENKVTETNLTINPEIFLPLPLRSPKQCQKRCQDTKGCNFFAWDRGLCTNDRISWPLTFLFIFIFTIFSFSPTTLSLLTAPSTPATAGWRDQTAWEFPIPR